MRTDRTGMSSNESGMDNRRIRITTSHEAQSSMTRSVLCVLCVDAFAEGFLRVLSELRGYHRDRNRNKSSAQIDGHYGPPIANVQTRADQHGRRPRQMREQL